MKGTASQLAKLPPHTTHIGWHRYVLYGLNLILLSSTLAITEWQRRGHETITDTIELYHVPVVTSSIKIGEEINSLRRDFLTYTSRTGASGSTQDGTSTFELDPRVQTSMFLVAQEIGLIGELQAVYQGADFKESTTRIERQFYALEGAISDDLRKQGAAEAFVRKLGAFELSMQQLQRLHAFESSRLTQSLPADSRKRFQTLLLIVTALVIVSFITTNSIMRNIERATIRRKNSEARVRLLMDSTAEAIYGLDLDGHCTFCNTACLKVLGYESEDELHGQNMHELIHYAHADGSPYPVEECRIYRTFQTGKGTHCDDEVLWRSDGSCFAAEYWSYPIRRDGEILGSVLTFIDITERKKAEKELVRSLAEKEVLLKEIHHRVKNNLQIISSLLNLQSEQIKGDRLRGLFEESKNRVSAMALVHEKLYGSENLAEIEFGDYIQSLVGTLSDSFGGQAGPVRLVVAVQNTNLDIDTAIPCALIVNELVSNALKYAFRGDNRGTNGAPEIRVTMNCDAEGEIVLSVSDNGSGFPEDIDFRNTESLGLQIVNTLTEQLDGDIEVRSDGGGTTFMLNFTAIKQTVAL